MNMPTVSFRAGVPSDNRTLQRELRFDSPPHDPVILITEPATSVSGASKPWAGHRTLIVRDVELPRVRRLYTQGGARADDVFCYQDFTPASGGLSGERETATAQSAAECLRRKGIHAVVADRSVPLLYWHYLREAGIEVICDPSMGQMDRRRKDQQEIEHLRHAQRVTEDAIRMACEYIASCTARSDGVLLERDSEKSIKPLTLTSEKVKSMLDVFLMERGFSNPGHIVACGPIGADCHHSGAGELRTLEPIIIDVFPCDTRTLYNGDCTRMVVHGKASEIPERVVHMHRAVVDAKAAAIAAIRGGDIGVTGEDVHRAAMAVITARGYGANEASVHEPLPGSSGTSRSCRGGMPHGTGHGIGMQLKEPPLLDLKGPELVVGDAITVEPGVYVEGIGGMRIEDMVIVTPTGVMNLNSLPEHLTWG